MRLFGGPKPDHPLADPKEARRLLEGLPANDPVKALDELMHWTESVAATPGFKPETLLQLLFMLDEAAQPRVRKLAGDYFAAGRPSRFQEHRLWTALHTYWKAAGLAYARVVEQFVQGTKGIEAARAQLPLLLTRTLRCFAQQIKWLHMRYGPVDLGSWGLLNSTYAFAEARQLAQAKVSVVPGIEATPQNEFLKAVMFSVAAPDGMLPAEARLAERLIGALAPQFLIARAPADGLVFWTDLGQAITPARLSRVPQAGAGLRCFGAGSALKEVHDLAERVMIDGRVPAQSALGECEPHVALEMLRHLLVYWAPQPPERKAPRHSVKTRLSVTHGYSGVLDVLGGGDSLDFDNQNTESWIVENVSAGGFGAVVPQLKGDWLRVGVLLALQPEGGSNWLLGLVRRVNRVTGQQARVGIETLSRAPALLQFGISGVRGASESGIVLANGEGSAEARVVLRPGVFAPAQNLEVTRGGRQHVYLPQAIAERGEDYEIARFRELVRES